MEDETRSCGTGSTDTTPFSLNGVREDLTMRMDESSVRPIIKHYPADDSWINAKVMKHIRKTIITDEILPIVEMFPTIEGEGSHLGTPRYFVRLGGCPIGCKGCDSPYTFGIKKNKVWTVIDLYHHIMDELAVEGIKTVSITGGEPMLYPKQLMTLASLLHKQGIKVSLETSGMILDTEVFALFDHLSLDIKTPSSTVPVSIDCARTLINVIKGHPSAQLKAVIWNEDDLGWLYVNCWQILRDFSMSPLILTPGSPIMTDIEDIRDVVKGWTKIIDMILEWNKQYNIRVIPQIHKLFGWR